jgi:hypothetical protein
MSASSTASVRYLVVARRDVCLSSLRVLAMQCCALMGKKELPRAVTIADQMW